MERNLKYLAGLLLTIVLSVALVNEAAAGRAGKLDPSFGGNGVTVVQAKSPYSSGWGIGRTSKGQVVVGVFAGADTGSVIRFTQRGRLDRSFGRSGRKPLYFGAWGVNPRDLIVDGRDRVLVAGEASRLGTANYRGGLARLYPNGHIDRSFSGDGLALPAAIKRVTPNEIALGRDGTITLVGSVGGTPSRRVLVARFRPNGRLDRRFSGNGYRILTVGEAQASRSVAIDRRGRTVVGSGSSMKSGNGGARAVFSIFRLTGKGRLDPSFAGDGRVEVDPSNADDQFQDLSIDRRGRITAVGDTTGPSGSIARLRPNGRLDRSFSRDGRKGLDMSPSSVSTDRRGRVIVVGSESYGGWSSAAAILRLWPNGADDRSFDTNPGGLSYLKDHFIDGRNRIVASGARGRRTVGAVRIINPPVTGPTSRGRG
jgi:uncharacterized delta-60 repeat protein